MIRRRLDNIRGSWLALLVLACVGLILGFGLGSERVVRIAREHLPASLGGGTKRDAAFWERPENKPPEPEPTPEEKEDVLPTVDPQDSFRGLVRDAEGHPLAGATVSAERWRESKWEVLAVARTNREGRFVLGPVARAHLSVSARAEGYASLRKAARTGASLEFVLKKGGNLALRVVDAVTGDAIKDCSLRGWSEAGSWYEQALTDGEGRVRFPSVPPGRVYLQVSPPAHRETHISDLDVREGQETFKEIPVVKGGKLTGKVLDRDTGAPVPGATLRTWDATKQAISGEDGAYEIQSPSQGGISFRVSAPEYPEQWAWVQTGGDPGGEYKQDVKVGKGGKVSGLVKGTDGNPVAGARVGQDPGRLMTGVPEQTATTDAEGKFVLESVPSTGGGRLYAIAEGFALTRSDPVSVRPGSESAGIVITLQSGALFKGTAKDEDGEPLAGVAFTLNREWSQNDGGWFWVPGLVGYSVEDGTFEIPAVPEGTYRLQVYLEGYAPESRRPLVAPAAGEVAGLDFLLRKGGAITGVVRSLEGLPLQGANVNAWGWVIQSDGSRSWNQRSDVRTDEQGVFVLDGLRDGSYQVNVTLTGFQAASLSGISAGTRELQVTLEPSARIEGVVVEADGTTPCPAFSLKVVQERTEEGDPAQEQNVVIDQEFADREGKFVVQDLARGQYALYAVAASKISRRVEGIFLTPGARISALRLVLAEGGRLKVVVRDPAGSTLQGASVSVGRDRGGGDVNYQFWAQSNQEGEASFAALPDGAWFVNADFQGRLRANRRVVLGSGSEIDLDITLRVGGAVLVAVVDAAGAPVADAGVQFFEREGGPAIELNWSQIWQEAMHRNPGGRIDWQAAQRMATRTDGTGHLRRQSLPPGSLFVTVEREGYERAAATVNSIDGYEVDLRVTLRPVEPPEGTAPGSGDGTDDEW